MPDAVGNVFRYLWDGNVMVQEWQYDENARPQHSIDEFGRIRMLGDEPVENLVTWVYEEGSYVPVAKIQDGERYTIISDYMGRPVEAYNSYGTIVWQGDYDISMVTCAIAKASVTSSPSASWVSMRTTRRVCTTTDSDIMTRGRVITSVRTR